MGRRRGLEETLERVWSFLAHATYSFTAIAGALTEGQKEWRPWIIGALFNQACKPLGNGANLRHIDEVLRLEFSLSSFRAPDNFY